MLQKVLSNIDIYTDTIKGTEIPLPKLRVDIFESFELGNNSEENYAKIDLHKNIVDTIVLVF